MTRREKAMSGRGGAHEKTRKTVALCPIVCCIYFVLALTTGALVNHISSEGLVPIICTDNRANSFNDHHALIQISAPFHQAVPEHAVILLLDDLHLFTQTWYYSALSYPMLNDRLSTALVLRDPDLADVDDGDEKDVPLSVQRRILLPFGQVKGLHSTEIEGFDKTVERELTAPQRAAWQRELDARTAYRDAAIVSLVLGEFDRRYLLTAPQWDRLLALLGKVMQGYGPDMQRLFAYSAASAPWYLQGFTMFLPLQGIPEDDLEKALGKERWERWTSSSEHANGSQYWRNVMTFHEQRKKESEK